MPAGVYKRTLIPPIVRLLRRTQENKNGCWEWTGYKDPAGYGQIGTPSGVKLVHRVSYEYYVGKIPDGLQIDHLCRNRPCVNPEHLEPVTAKENVGRGMAGRVRTLLAAQQTHCKWGHEFTKSNTYICRKGIRNCRRCHKRRERERRERIKINNAPLS